MSVSDLNSNPEVNSVEQNNGPSVEELMAKIEKLESTNSRLLDESAKNRNKFIEVRDKYEELDEIRKAKMTAEERLEEREREISERDQLLKQKEDKLFHANMRSSSHARGS